MISGDSNISDPERVAFFFPMTSSRHAPEMRFLGILFSVKWMYRVTVIRGKSYPKQEFRLIGRYWANL